MKGENSVLVAKTYVKREKDMLYYVKTCADGTLDVMKAPIVRRVKAKKEETPQAVV